MLRLQSPDAWFLYACYREHKQAPLLGLTWAGGGGNCVQSDKDGDIGERALDGAQGSLLLVAREGQDLGREQNLIETLRIPFGQNLHGFISDEGSTWVGSDLLSQAVFRKT